MKGKLGIFSVAVVILAVGAGWLAVRSQRPPSPEDCVALWNRPGDEVNRAAAAEVESQRAAVFGWQAKGVYDYCSVMLVDGRGCPIVSFDYALTTEDFGRRWGRSPWPGCSHLPRRMTVNASVTSAGRVTLHSG